MTLRTQVNPGLLYQRLAKLQYHRFKHGVVLTIYRASHSG